MSRPCELDAVNEVARVHSFGWGKPVFHEKEFPWVAFSKSQGFIKAGIVHSDSDWDALPPDETLRYILIYVNGRWELRWGVTDPGLDPKLAQTQGKGTHRLMMTVPEMDQANTEGLPIKSGYIYSVTKDNIRLD